MDTDPSETDPEAEASSPIVLVFGPPPHILAMRARYGLKLERARVTGAFIVLSITLLGLALLQLKSMATYHTSILVAVSALRMVPLTICLIRMNAISRMIKAIDPPPPP